LAVAAVARSWPLPIFRGMGYQTLLALTVSVLCTRESLGQARVVSAPSAPSLLNLTGNWARASMLGDLRDLRVQRDHIELRVWHGYGSSETQAIVLRRADAHWSAFLARVIRCEIQIPAAAYDTASAVTMRSFVAEAKRNCGRSVTDVSAGSRIIAADTLVVERIDVPEAEIEKAWADAQQAGVLQLPSRVKRAMTRDDGVTYVIELRRGDEYRASEIEHVEPAEVDVDSQIKRLYAALQRLRER
jgi:hypothetical protein